MSRPPRPAPYLAWVAVASTLLLAGPAWANYPWPTDGAPVCTAPGDQHRLFYSDAGCNVLAFNWLSSAATGDTVRSRWVGPIPPTSECGGFDMSEDAGGKAELSAVEVRTPVIALDVPWCTGPGPSAQLWLRGTGASSQLVLQNGVWFSPSYAEQVIADDGDFVRHHPRMAPSGNTYVDTALVVVWSDERTGAPQIRAQRVTWMGVREWGPTGILVAPTGAPQSEPEIARLQDGSSLVVWLDARSGGSDVYALRLLADGTVATGWPAGGLALEDRPELSGSPLIVGATSHTGPSLVVWEESGPHFGGGRSIVARRLLADGTPDPVWSALGVSLSSSATVDHLQDARNAGSFSSPALVAVWTDTRAAAGSNPSDLYAQWLTPAGVPASGWPGSGLAICTASGSQVAARVSVTDSYAAFAWEDHRGADADVYATLRLANGTLPPGFWVPDGLPATSAPGDQTAPVVGTGNGGGCLVAWEDGRDLATTGLDIYAQAFTSEGEKLDVPTGPPPPRLALGAPRPNPSRGTSIFSLGVPIASQGRVDVLDVAGRRVRTLAAREFAAGTREVVFDGRDDAGRELRPGVYRVLARVGGETTSRTIVLVQ